MSNKINIPGDAECSMIANVHINVVNKKTNSIIKTIEGHNRATKLALMGLIRFTNGEFNPSSPDYLEFVRKYIPRYLALGTNIPTEINQGVSSMVDVNDSKLLAEIVDPINGESQRIKLTQRNQISNRYVDPYIRLIIRCYIPETMFNDNVIKEAGLFTQETGNNCWARIVLPEGINKTKDIVLDVMWELTFVSMESTNQPYEESKGLKSTLYTLIVEGLSKIKSQYTEESWNIFYKELNLSSAVYYYNSALDEVIQERITALTAAIEQLTKRI